MLCDRLRPVCQIRGHGPAPSSAQPPQPETSPTPQCQRSTPGPPPRGVDAASQADSGEGGWVEFDLGRALRLLHSPDQFIVRRTLRRLHICFWHAPARRLKELLKRAGAPTPAIALVGEIVETCRACRLWTRPGPRSITSSTRLASMFNEVVQWDILFHRDVLISHLLDEAIRYGVASVLN